MVKLISVTDNIPIFDKLDSSRILLAIYIHSVSLMDENIHVSVNSKGP